MKLNEQSGFSLIKYSQLKLTKKNKTSFDWLITSTRE